MQICPKIAPELGTVQSAALELVREGVMLFSRGLQLIYSNEKAKEICQQLWSDRCSSDQLPRVISELLPWLSRNFSSEHETFIIDYQLNEDRIIRIRAYLLSFDCEPKLICSNCPRLLLFLEDRSAIFQDELRIEQKKYNLSDRELEVLSLLSQSCSYQEISNRLQISINTVKAHVKKINLKKQSYSNQKIFLKIDKQQ